MIAITRARRQCDASSFSKACTDIPMARIGAHLRCTAEGLSLRPLTAADDPLCRSLSEAASRLAISSAVPEPMLAALLVQQFEAQRVGYRQAYPDAEYFAVIADGVAVGRVVVAIVERGDVNAADLGVDVASSQPCSQALRIVDIALLPSAQRRGIGSAVIAIMVKAARELGAERLTLSVTCSNEGARRLYSRLGFVETGGEAVLEMAMPLR